MFSSIWQPFRFGNRSVSNCLFLKQEKIGTVFAKSERFYHENPDPGHKRKEISDRLRKKQLDSFYKNSRKKKKILIDLGIFKNRLTIRERCDRIINVVS